MRAFIARDLDGALYLYTSNPPIKAEEGWVPSSKLDTLSSLNWKLFPEVKWEDEEPTEINIEIVNKKKSINKAHFYMVRDFDNVLRLYLGKPYRCSGGFYTISEGCFVTRQEYFYQFGLDKKDFESLKFEDEPIEVFVNM